jgi:hypothetical protein
MMQKFNVSTAWAAILNLDLIGSRHKSGLLSGWRGLRQYRQQFLKLEKQHQMSDSLRRIK